MRVLVLGGAGYIGSHMVRYLQSHGDEVVVFDNLSTGHHAALSDCRLIEGDLLDGAALGRCLSEVTPDVLMHFAARSIVPESVRQPHAYYQANVGGSMNLLAAMHEHGVRNLIFSSTAAVYGHPATTPVREDAALLPISPYGRSKLFIEQMITDYASAYGISAISLRYFNAAGADAGGNIGEAHEPETHLIPNILRSVAEPARALQIFGTDHPTADGSCVRDYIHVSDLCSAHHLAAQRVMQAAAGSHECFNLGLGRGYSVLEILHSAQAVLGQSILHTVAPARAGDPPELVAAPDRAQAALGWRCEHSDIDNIIATAWAWHRQPRY